MSKTAAPKPPHFACLRFKLSGVRRGHGGARGHDREGSEGRRLTGNQAMTIFMRKESDDGGAFVWDWVIPGIEFEFEGERGPRD